MPVPKPLTYPDRVFVGTSASDIQEDRSGRFTETPKEKLEMVVSVSDAILAAVRPGVTFADLKEVALAKIPKKGRTYMQAAGFYGHHIGFSSGDPALTDVPLEPGMVFTVEPWYYNHHEEIAVFIEDVVLVTANGHEPDGVSPADDRKIRKLRCRKGATALTSAS